MPQLKLFEAPNSALSKDQQVLGLDVEMMQLKRSGADVVRFNFRDHAQVFEAHPQVLAEMGKDFEFLPIFLLGEQIVSKAAYPSKKQLAEWTGVVISETGGCGGGGRCMCGGS